jgi:1-deoxyxylulose-5-phosphate synthase
MEYVHLGSTGVKVSRICLGCMTYGSKKWREWVLEEQESRPLIRQAIEAGVNFFDTADVYSLGTSEEILGRALKEFGPSRDRLVVATKVHGVMGDDPNQRGLSRKHIFHAIDDSLRRLQMDYVDLYQIHRFDPATPIEETLEALRAVVRSGKALYLGASSMWVWQFAKLLHAADQHDCPRFVTMQNHYNLLYREEEREMIPFCRSEGIGIIPWSPLARGKLTRPRDTATVRSKTDDFARRLYGGTAEADDKVIARVHELAAAHGVPSARIALAWLLQKPGVTAPIVGASQPQHVEDAVAALSVKLTAEEIKAMEEPYVPHPVVGHE